MGYWTTLHLINIKIKKESVASVLRAIRNPKERGTAHIRFFLERAFIDCEGELAWHASKDGLDPYVPCDDGAVYASNAKWYESGYVARWLRRHCESGGRLIEHSLEGDGEAWGWEFDGRGRMRKLELKVSGKWE